jgi:hypothetical protein
MLDLLISFSDSIKEDVPIETPINSVQDVRKNVKSVF